MLRLMVIGADADAWRNSMMRIRDATLAAPAEALQSQALPEDCDAAAFVGAALPERDAVQRFLTAGKHVLVAAESCYWAAELDTLLSAAQQRGARLGVAHPDRYLPSRQLIARQLEAGKLGTPGLVRLHRWEPRAGDKHAADIPPALVRDIDLVLWFMRQPPNLVYAVDATHDAGRYVQVHLGFRDGAMALIDFCGSLPPGDGYNSLSVIGSAGAAHVDDHQNMQLVYTGGHARALRTDEGTSALAAVLQAFVDAVRSGTDLTAGVTAWRPVCTTVDAARRSLESRQPVVVERS
jgi:predicted dehydrogenase